MSEIPASSNLIIYLDDRASNYSSFSVSVGWLGSKEIRSLRAADSFAIKFYIQSHLYSCAQRLYQGPRSGWSIIAH